MIEVEKLTKRYGDRTAVSDVSFSVQRGEIVGFLGPNGAGKSTTLRMITGFLAPTSGGVRVDGIDALSRSLEARRRIGYMPEGVPLYPELRVREYLRFRAELKGVPRAKLGARVDAALEQAAIGDVRDRIVGQLSKGYRQRVGLADALVADPPLLILDEPTSGLDPNQIRQVRKLIEGFAGDKTVFLSTHILPEVEATCGRVIIINKGELVGEGAPETLRSAAQKDAGQLVTLVVRDPQAGGAPAERARALLEQVDGVRSVDRADVDADVVRVVLGTETSAEVIERVAAAAVAGGLLLRGLSRAEARLEDVFTNLTTEDRAAKAEERAEAEEAEAEGAEEEEALEEEEAEEEEAEDQDEEGAQ